MKSVHIGRERLAKTIRDEKLLYSPDQWCVIVSEEVVKKRLAKVGKNYEIVANNINNNNNNDNNTNNYNDNE